MQLLKYRYCGYFGTGSANESVINKVKQRHQLILTYLPNDIVLWLALWWGEHESVVELEVVKSGLNVATRYIILFTTQLTPFRFYPVAPNSITNKTATTTRYSPRECLLFSLYYFTSTTSNNAAAAALYLPPIVRTGNCNVRRKYFQELGGTCGALCCRSAYREWFWWTDVQLPFSMWSASK